MPTNALILSGGGARAAYQVGVLLAVAEICPHLKTPFPIICGTSAGAINAAAIAAHSGDFHQSAADLASTWRAITVDQVFHNNLRSLVCGVARMGLSLFHEGSSKTNAFALLDNSPLRDFLHKVLPLENIALRIKAKQLEALCITALGYNSGDSVSFFQGNPSLSGWRKFRGVGRPTTITVEHLMASSAIPAIFPAVELKREYFGDGAMRQISPISPAVYLGADRIFVIGVSGNRNPAHWGKRGRMPPKHTPSIAQILGQMLNSAFIDALEGDIEQMELVNQLLSRMPQDLCVDTKLLRRTETLVISPSKELDKIAGRKVRHLPSSLRFFMRSTGATAKGGGSAAASYLSFTREYCEELIDLGYQDAMWERESIEKFFST